MQEGTSSVFVLGLSIWAYGVYSDMIKNEVVHRRQHALP